MIYVLWDDSEDDSRPLAVLDGPDDLDIDALWIDFCNRTEIGKPPDSVFPIYQGPMKLFDGSGPNDAHVYGYFSPPGSMVPDYASPQYKHWKADCEARERLWKSERMEKISQFWNGCPGSGEHELFLAYLEKEHGLKVVPHEVVEL